MIKLRRKKSTRTFQCDVSGCRNRTSYLISKRDDVACSPLHLCDECIRGLYGMLTEETAPEVPTLAPDGGLSVNGGIAALQPVKTDTFDFGEAEPAEDSPAMTLEEFLVAESDMRNAEPEPDPEEKPKAAPKRRTTTKKTGGKK